jgi:serine/threonine-protein kinase
VLDRLGEGGMGVVYKAFDPDLDRPIALKLVHAAEGTDGDQRERLLREAQALAKLKHPNVIAVHDVGTLGDDVFIAMEYVEGQTVRTWLAAQRRTEREILEVFVAAGEGLAAAHRAGLVHRDFKPDNLMVDGEGRVRVLDFGLARAVTAPRSDGEAGSPPERATYESPPLAAGAPTVDMSPRVLRSRPPAPSTVLPSAGDFSTGRLLAIPLTRIGTIVGTPRFMAPEQHFGEPVDAAADQFGFCVSLYWALYNAFPFAGSNTDDVLDAMLARRFEEPPPGPAVPRWLRQVLLRGLAPEANERFPSMEALLVALRADPHAARRRWLRGALIVLATLAAVSAVVAGSFAYRARRAITAQSQLAQQFGREVEQIATIARTAVFQPLHDTRRERKAIAARMELLKQRMQLLGPLAAGPGHEALGRGYLALERYDDALRELQAAHATGYLSPELAYALGLVHGKLYQRALADLPKTQDEQHDAARRAEIARLHRDPALRHLREVTSLGLDGQTALGSDAPAYLEGLIALYEQRYEDALRSAQKAEEEALWPYDARTLKGNIHIMAGDDLWLKGDATGALDQFGQAGEAYRAAYENARSGFAAYVGDCERLVAMIPILEAQDRSPESTVRAALSACASAATARPDDDMPLAKQAAAWQHLGDYQRSHGVDPIAANQQAIRTGEAALAIEPDSFPAHVILGFANLAIGDYRSDKGDDPRADLERALVHARRTVEIDPQSFDGYDLLHRIYEARGSYAEDTGADPRPDYQLSGESARKALAVSPDSFLGWNALGASAWYLGNWEATHGHDPSAAFARAEEAYANVVRISPALDAGHLNLCSLLSGWARFERRRGVDPRPRLERAIASCRRALELDGNDASSYSQLGDAFLILGEWQLEQSSDPMEMIQRARRGWQRSIEIDRGYQQALVALADSQVLEARWVAAHGRDPIPALGRASSWARRALELSGGRSCAALGLLAVISRWRGEWRAQRGGSAKADVEEGLDYAARALARNPQLAEAAAVEGALHLLAARTARTPADRLAAATRARAALEKGLAVDASLEHEYRPLYLEAQRLAP